MTSSSLNELRLAQVEKALEPFETLSGKSTPPGGWLRSIRESLGRSLRSQAALLGVAFATLQQSEQAEADDRITLAQLRKLAAGLDCELVYALVPRKPLREMVQARAEVLARQEVMGVAHTMRLENQAVSVEDLEGQKRRIVADYLAHFSRKLWDKE